MAAMRVGTLLLLLALSAELALSRELTGRQSDQPFHLSTKHNEAGVRPLQYGDLDNLVKALQRGKLDVRDVGGSGAAGSDQQEPVPAGGDAAAKVPQQLPKVPAARAPAAAVPQPAPVPIVTRRKGALACSHQYKFGKRMMKKTQ